MPERDRVLGQYATLMMDDTKEMLLSLPDDFLDSVLGDIESVARVRGEATLSVIRRCAETGGLSDKWVIEAERDIRSQYGVLVIERVMDALSVLLSDMRHVGDCDEDAMLGAVATHIRMVAQGLTSGRLDPLVVGRDGGWDDAMVNADGTTDGMQDEERDVLDVALFSPVISEEDIAYASNVRVAWAHARQLLRGCECLRIWGIREQLFVPMSVVSSCEGALGVASRIGGLFADDLEDVRRMVEEASSIVAEKAKTLAGELLRYVPDDDWGDDYGTFERDLASLRDSLDGSVSRMAWQDDFLFTRLDIDGRGRLIDFLSEEVPEARFFPQAKPFWDATRNLHMLMFLQDALRSALSELSEYGDERQGVHVANLSKTLANAMSALGDALSDLAGKAVPLPTPAWEEIGRSWGESGDLVRKALACKPSLFGGSEMDSVAVHSNEKWEEACRLRDERIGEWDFRREWLEGHPDEEISFDLWGSQVAIPPGMRGIPLETSGISRSWADALAEAGMCRLEDLAGLGIEQVIEIGGVGLGAVEDFRHGLASLGLVTDEASPDEDIVQAIDDVLKTLGVTAGGQEGPADIGDIDLDALI